MLSLSLYIYIYIHIYTNLLFTGSALFGLRFSDASWLGPVRFGSFLRPVPAGSGINRFGSVRIGSAGSVRFQVSYSFLSLVPPGPRWGARCMYCKQALHEKVCIAYSHLLGNSLLCNHSHSSRCQSYISKGIGRQGTGSFVRNSYVSTLCPVVICPYFCTSDTCAPSIAVVTITIINSYYYCYYYYYHYYYYYYIGVIINITIIIIITTSNGP